VEIRRKGLTVAGVALSVAALVMTQGVAGAAANGGRRAAEPSGASSASVPAGYVVARSASIPLPSQTQTRGVVTCPAGTKPVSGGALEDTGDLNINISSSYPNKTRGWVVRMNNGSLDDSSMTVWAVCVHRPTTNFTVVTTQWVAFKDRPDGTSVNCPSGVVVGGGVLMAAHATSVNVNSSYPPSTTAWSVIVNNDSPHDDYFFVYAVCRNTEPRGYSIQQGAPTNVPVGSDTLVSASCPGAAVPLGGGVSDGGAEYRGANLNSSYPDGQAWSNHYNNVGTDAPVTPYVICAGS
jgi:hypothetical protein